MLPRNAVITGDAATELRALPASSVDMVLTSPPYFALRDYAVPGQLGLEPDVTTWADALLGVTSELSRLLVPTGSLWLNLGDTYGTHPRQGAPRKSLLLAPERVALALVADGWTLRNKIVWHKPNPQPSSVRDRLTCAWELVYVLTRRPHYFFDLDAIRRPHRSRPTRHGSRPLTPIPVDAEAWRGPNGASRAGLVRWP